MAFSQGSSLRFADGSGGEPALFLSSPGVASALLTGPPASPSLPSHQLLLGKSNASPDATGRSQTAGGGDGTSSFGPPSSVAMAPRCCYPLWVVSPYPVDVAVLSGLWSGCPTLNSSNRISCHFPSAWN